MSLRATTAVVVTLGVLAAVWACFDDVVGPRGVVGQLALAPAFESEAAGIVDVDRVRVTLQRAGQERFALDTVISLAGSDSVDFTLTVAMLSQTETFTLNLQLITPAGDTAFRAGPESVTPTAGGGGGGTIEPIDVTFRYTGVGADAAGVRILSTELSAFFGETVAVVAEAFGTDEEPIPGTPIVFASLDALGGAFPDPASGSFTAGTQRGPTEVTATLLTGPADTTAILVQPSPSDLVAESGDGQSGLVGSQLADLLVARVLASDGLGVAGVTVDFAVVTGGGSVSAASVVTDAQGRASVTWTLGSVIGIHRVQATVAELPDVVAEFTAEALIRVGVISWISTTSGNWGDAANWDLGRIPNVLDTVVIDLSGDYTVTLDVDATVRALEVGGATGTQTLAVGSRTLTVDSSATFVGGSTGVLALSGGTLAGSGTVLVEGRLVWSGGTMTDAGITRVASGGLLDLSGGLKNLRGGRRLELAGSGTWSAGDIQTGEGSVFAVEAGGALTAAATVNLLNFFGGTTPAFTNAGSVVVNATEASVAFNAVTFDNAGSVDIQDGVLVLTGGGTSSGSFGVASPGILQFGAGTHVLDGSSSISGFGSVIFSAGTTTLSGVYDVAGSTLVNGGTVNFNTTAGATAGLTFEAGTLAGTGLLTVSNGFNWSGGTVGSANQPGGTTRVAEGGALGMGSATGQRSLTNDYTIASAGFAGMSAGGDIVGGSGGRLHIEATGDLFISDGVSFTHGLSGAAPVFVNDGVVTVSPFEATVDITAVFNNAGTVLMDVGAALALGGGGTSVGSFTVPAGASLAYTGGTHVLSAGSSFDNGGTLDIRSGVLDVNGDFTHADRAVLQGEGTLDLLDANVLAFDGDVNPGASPGILTVVGDFPQSVSSTVNIELNGTVAGSDYDQLRISGIGFLASFNGALALSPTFAPLAASTFGVISFPSRSGGFATVSGRDLVPSVGVGMVLDTSWASNALNLMARGQILFHGDDFASSIGIFRTNGDATLTQNITDEFSTQEYGDPRWSPDYKWVTYGGNISAGNNFLHIAAPSGNLDSIYHVVNDVNTRRARFNTNGRHIAFECSDGVSLTFIDVCAMTGVDAPTNNMGDAGGTNEKVFVTSSIFALSGSPTAFAWNPLNADQLAVVRNQLIGDFATTVFYTVNVDGSNDTPIGQLPDGVTIVGTMDWSPAAALLAFGTSDGDIWTLDVASRTLKQVTLDGSNKNDQNPVFSPDGSTLLFVGLAGCAVEWYMVPTTGGTETQLTDEANGGACEDFGSDGGPFAADWSPDGAYIVFSQVRTIDFNSVVYIAPASITTATYPENAMLVRIPSTSLRDIQPSWRP